MAEQVLGVGFEIHSGGNDLTFPHHENEAAQTRRARGAELSRIWMHNGMLQMGGEKMAKSVGNITSLADALAEHGRDAVIMFFVSGHYRQPIQFDETTMAQAAANVRRVREAARRLVPGPSPDDLAGHKERFFAALADDFNTPTALAEVWDWIREANRREPGTGDADLREMLQILALDNLLDARGSRRRARCRRPRPARAARGRPRRARLRRGRSPARRARRAGLAGARLRRRPAARARRSVSATTSSTGATRSARRCAPAGARCTACGPRAGRPPSRGCATWTSSRRASRTSPRARAARPTRACAPRSARTPTSTRRSCWSAPTRSSSSSTSSRIPRTSGRSAARPSAWAPTAW